MSNYGFPRLVQGELPSDQVELSTREARINSAPERFSSCSDCSVYDLSLCPAGGTKKREETSRQSDPSLPIPSVHTIPARRTIRHPTEWSEFTPVICTGWATSSFSLPDGRRQILSFLLPGDIVSTTCLFQPVYDHLIESVTEVTYCNFKRNEFRAFLFTHAAMLEKLTMTWIQDKAHADQLAVDLGRRTADERIARLILNLMERLAKRGMVRDNTVEFPLRQHHIADATGLTPVHVSKVLSEFRRAGLIEINERMLTVLDPAGFRRIATQR